MKKCKQGYYYCYKDKKCKRIPGGYRVGLGGYLRREREEERSEDSGETETKKNGNGNGNGNGGNGNGGNGGGGVSESVMTKAQIKKRDEIADSMSTREFNKRYGKDRGKSVKYATATKLAMGEGWSDKYKKSIDCDNPKGFSQKAHCQGKKKMNEQTCPVCGFDPCQCLEGVITEKRDGKSSKDKGYSLRDWFKGGGWKQTGGKYDGKPCAKQPGQKTKPYCRDADDRAAMSKEERNKRARKKRKEDPNPNRKGKARNVTQESYSNWRQDLQEKPGDGYLGPTIKVGKKEYGVPNPIRIAQDAADNTNRANQRKVDAVRAHGGTASMPPYKLYNNQTSTASQTLFGMQKQSYEPEGEVVEGYDDGDVIRPTDRIRMKDGKLRTLKDLDAKLKDKGTKKEEVEFVNEMTPGGRAREAINYQRGGYHGDADFFKQHQDAIKDNLLRLSPYGPGGFPKARAKAKPKTKPTTQMAGYEPEGEMVDENLAQMAANITDALPWNRNTKYTTQGKLRNPGENVHGKQTGRGLNTSTASMSAGGTAETNRRPNPYLQGGKVVQRNSYEPEGELVDEGKKDACYHKVKSRYSVWPSAYASGALVKCRKVGAKNWGNKTKKEEFSNWRNDLEEMASEKKIDKKLQKPVDSKKLKPANYVKDAIMMPGHGIEKKIQDDYQYSNWRDDFTPTEYETTDLIKADPIQVPPSNLQKIEEAKKCWKGYKKVGTQKLFGKTYNRCEKIKKEHYDWRAELEEGAAWTKKSGKNPSGGLNEKGRKSYERENPGSDLKRPSKKVGNKRRKSFCARMKGMKKKLTSKKTANDPNSRINKSLRAWNC